MIVAATAAVAVLFWLEPLARRIDRASSTLAGLFYLLGFLTLNTTAHLHGHWRRHGKPRLRISARGTDGGTAFTYSLAGVDDVDPPDPAIRAIPAAIAVGAAFLGFAAAMTIVAVWTRPEPLGRNPWIAAYWIALILLLLTAAAWRITKQITDLYDWAVDRDARARAAAATPVNTSR
jgi:hypothetical protein